MYQWKWEGKIIKNLPIPHYYNTSFSLASPCNFLANS
nr:MAG TPA: hypothetical protein [Bacteriophage sp.]